MRIQILCNNLFGSKKKRKGCSCYKKINSTPKTKHKNNLPGSSSGGLHGREKKKDNMLNISTPTNIMTKKDMIDLLEQFSAPIILLENFNAHNPLWVSYHFPIIIKDEREVSTK